MFKKKDDHMSDVQFLNGNINSAVIVLGEETLNDENGEPQKTGNLIVAPLPASISVPANTVSKTEGTPDAD